MAKRILSYLFICFLITTVTGYNPCSKEKNEMKFKFESLDSLEYFHGSYLMDFSENESQRESAIDEGKLLTVFGSPALVSENYENSFNYFIRVTAEDGRSVILNVYNVGVVHIGATDKDPFTVQAAKALIEYVNSAKPADYSRTVYYLDCDVQIDISVKNGNVTIYTSEISSTKSDELFEKFYG